MRNKSVHYFSLFLFVIFSGTPSGLRAQQAVPPFRNARLSIDARTRDLLGRLTLEEKISLLGYRSSAVPRLGIPSYNWWNEALHGVARAGTATVFPQAIAMAATFNDSLLKAEANAISTEARAKYNLAVAKDRRLQYMGLTFWSPNINIFRDPRWGRGQETYGEDPFLTASMGLAFIKGLQGNDPHYLKTAACAKHFAVHSGPEAGRHSFNSVVDEKDLRETYLYAFKKLVKGGVESVMCGYNRLNGEPCCTNNTLLTDILHKEWGFKGHVVTDCGALNDILDYHKVMDDPAIVAAAAIKAGVSLDCSNLLQKDLMKAYDRKLITGPEIDSALSVLLHTQFKLGFFDDKSLVPFSKLGAESVHSPAHIALARKAAQQSMVLLKNDKGLLPLNKNKYGSIMVLGANAGAMDPLVANYHGMSGNMVTFAEGITAAAGPGVAVQYDQGSDYTDTVHFGGIWAAGESDITIAVIGLTPVYEGEEGDAFLAAHGGDKLSLDLPAAHIALLKELRKKKKPVIAVVTAGSNVDISAIEPYADAIILAWYPGEQGGNALADILFGEVSPAGRLPVTFYKSLQDIPAYDSYGMTGRTYRYFDGNVQYPFGYGLSYTSFDYSWHRQPTGVRTSKDTLAFSIAIKNTGAMDGDEVAQVYVRYPAIERMPLKELKSFRRVHVGKGREQSVEFRIPVAELQKWDLKEKKWVLYPGDYTIVIGGNSADTKLSAVIKIQDAGTAAATGTATTTGVAATGAKTAPAYLTPYVDPFIGTGFHGHVFLGANVPFGGVQLGPVNMSEGWDWCSGYHYSDSLITGFAHTHLSGTGIGDLGDISLMPATGNVVMAKGKAGRPESGYYSPFTHTSEQAKPGYYVVTLERYGIKAQLTATERVGFHRYTFPASDDAKIIIDLESGIGWDRPDSVFIKKINDTTIAGFRFSKGWAPSQQIFFTAVFSKPLRGFLLYDSTALKSGNAISGKKIRGVALFTTAAKEKIFVKVGISPVSMDNAMANIAAEIPGWDFNAVQAKADAAWNNELNKVRVKDRDPDRMRTFYTALYHTMIAPSIFNDHNGDYRGTDKKVYAHAPFTNLTTFSLWDTYRAAHPLFTLFQSERVSDMVNTMLAIYQQQGKLPVWHLMGNETNTMPGYSAVQVVADAYLKGFRGFDTALAWEAVRTTALQDQRGLYFVKKYGKPA